MGISLTGGLTKNKPATTSTRRRWRGAAGEICKNGTANIGLCIFSIGPTFHRYRWSHSVNSLGVAKLQVVNVCSPNIAMMMTEKEGCHHLLSASTNYGKG